MSKVILLILLLAVLGLGWYTAGRRYPSQKIDVAGTRYEVILFDRGCDGPRMCVAQVAFLTATSDTTALITEGMALLPWVEANAFEAGDRGATLVAVKPGFCGYSQPGKRPGYSMDLPAKAPGNIWDSGASRPS